MKRVLSILTILIISLSFWGTADAKSSTAFTSKNSFSVFINGKKAAEKIPVISTNNIYLIYSTPILQALGGKTSLKASSNKVSITYKTKKYVLYLNKKVAYVGSARIPLSAAPKILNGKTMIPITLLEKISGMKVILDSKNRKAKMVTPKQPSRISGKIVVIDPGHGGITNGAKYGGLKEKDMNLDVSLRLYSLLKSKGIKVYMTRRTDCTMSLAQRYKYANSLKASLFISVHHNALPNNMSYKGTETLYSPRSATLKGMNGRKLASIVQTELVKSLGTISRGIISRPELAVLRHCNMPSVIAEIGYMTNKNERSRINTAKFRQKAAEALCSSIVKALNQMY